MPKETFYDEIEIEDFTWDPLANVFHYPCPCGDRFEITKSQLRDGDEVARCPSCSLLIRVVYEWDDFEDYDSADEADGIAADEEEEEEGGVSNSGSGVATSVKVDSDAVTATEALSGLKISENEKDKQKEKDKEKGKEKGKNGQGAGAGSGSGIGVIKGVGDDGVESSSGSSGSRSPKEGLE